jgi:hypothetical protein
MIEMTVDAKQRFKAFKTKEIGAISGFEVRGICRARSGTDANTVKTMGERTLEACRQYGCGGYARKELLPCNFP